MTREVRRIDYRDGGWCLQEYEEGELHGSWRVFRADGSVSWERRYAHGFQQGVARTYDETGRVREEQWFVDDALHGPSTLIGSNGAKSVSEFLFGYPVEALHDPANPDFKDLLLPLLNDAFRPSRETARAVLESLAKPTVPLAPGAPVDPEDPSQTSYLGHVTVLGSGEGWPEHEGRALSPVLQLFASELPLRPRPWDTIEAVTIFAVGDEVPTVLGRDIVVRVYRKGDQLRPAEVPEITPLCERCLLDFSEPKPSYPDANDLPPRLENLVRRDASLVQDAERHHLASRLSGWPGWIQSTRIVGLGRFALQLDSLDFPDWSCGDSTIHYLFDTLDGDGLDWLMEMA